MILISSILCGICILGTELDLIHNHNCNRFKIESSSNGPDCYIYTDIRIDSAIKSGNHYADRTHLVWNAIMKSNRIA